MAAFCAGFLENTLEQDLKAAEQKELTDQLEKDAEDELPHTPPPSKFRKMSGSSDSLGSAPKEAIRKRSSPKAVAKALFPGAHNAPPKPRSEDKKPRAARGSAGAFAGRRPPSDPVKLDCFEQMKADYKKVVMEISKSEKAISLSQEQYWTHMKKALGKVEDGSPQDRFTAAAKEYRQQLGLL